MKEEKKLKSLIIYLLQCRSKQLKTEIVKHCFLVDLEYAKLKQAKEGFSLTNYIKYFYGPYSPIFAGVLDELEKEGFITLIKRENDFCYVYILTPRIKEFDLSAINDDVKKIVQSVLSKTEGKKLQEIKDEAYSKEEFKKSEFNKPINLLGA